MRAAGSGSIISGGGMRGCSSSGGSMMRAPPQLQQQQHFAITAAASPRAACPSPQQLRPEALADAWCQRASLRRSARSSSRLPAFQQPAGYSPSAPTSQSPTMGGYSRSPPQQQDFRPPAPPGGGGGFPPPSHQQQQQLQQQQQGPPQQQQQQPGPAAAPPPPGASSTSLVSASSVDGGAGTALKAKEAPKTVQVRFWLKFHVDYGQTIRIIGGHDATGAWNLAKAPFLRWSEGDLWNVTLDLAAGGVYEYKYVVVESDGVTAASWQRGANNVLALQMNDEEVEVYDNWKNAPGALCVVDGQEITRERKLLAWAGDMSVQRGELRRTRMELAQAREEIRVLRAELSVLRMEVSEANIARAAAEARQVELERANSALRMEVTSSQASARSTMEEAVRLLTDMSAEEDILPSSGDPSGSSPYGTHASLDPASAGSSSSQQQQQHNNGGSGGMFGGLFNGFGMSGGSNGRAPGDAGDAATSSSNSPGGRAASVVAAAAAAMAAAAGPQQDASGSGSSSDGGYGSDSDSSSNGGGGGRFSAYINRTRQGN